MPNPNVALRRRLKPAVNRTLRAMFSRWKAISYRGGIVEFRIPRRWVEEYDEDGGGTFYDPTPDSNTLRLNVITVRSPSPVNADTPLEILRPRAQSHGVTVQFLASSNACITYSTPAQEAGIALLIHYWEVANAVPPAHARIAVFSFTTIASEQKAASRALQWLHEEIRACRFAAHLGFDGK